MLQNQHSRVLLVRVYGYAEDMKHLLISRLEFNSNSITTYLLLAPLISSSTTELFYAFSDSISAIETPAITAEYNDVAFHFFILSFRRETLLKSYYEMRIFNYYRVERNLGFYNAPTSRSTPYHNVFMHYLSTSPGFENLSWGANSKEILLGKLQTVIEDHKLNDAWDVYKDVKRIYGFPDKLVMGKLITEMSYSYDPKWIKKAGNLVLSISEEAPKLLHPDLLIKLSLALAREGLPVLTSMILRLMLSKKILPRVDMLRLVFHHMVTTETGTLLASNILIEFCETFQQLYSNRSISVKLRGPDAMICNLVLHGCVKFQSSIKSQQIIELMAQVGVVGDAYTIVMIAYIHEMNGMRDELKKLKGHVDLVSVTLLSHYQHFYDRLLSLHLKFNDIDAASELILDVYNLLVAKQMQETKSNLQKPFSIFIGSRHLREGLRLNMLPHDLPRDSVFKLEGKLELIIHRNGRLVLSDKALAKLIVSFKKNGRISELSKFLVQMHKRSDLSLYNSICVAVVDACVNLGWLETAHDVLDDTKLDGKCLGPSVYKTLLTAYCDRNMFREAETLLKQMKESGDSLESRNMEMDLAEFLSLYRKECIMNLKELPSHMVSSLGELVIRELKEDAKVLPTVNEFNSSIYFFMKAKMTADALKTYRRMHEMKIRPTEVTFYYLVSGYSSLTMYREITIVWGDMKKNQENGNLKIHRDLYEFILFNFLRGGYFARVMEIMSLMKANNMYLDRWMYKREYLKYHKDLYRRLKASDAKNESQSQRIEHVHAFREWVGLS